MSTSTSLDALTERVTAGERLSADEVRDLATTPDILSLGMLADALRRRVHPARVTFLRVAECAVDAPAVDAALTKAREIRITGSPVRLSDALDEGQVRLRLRLFVGGLPRLCNWRTGSGRLRG